MKVTWNPAHDAHAQMAAFALVLLCIPVVCIVLQRYLLLLLNYYTFAVDFACRATCRARRVACAPTTSCAWARTRTSAGTRTTARSDSDSDSDSDQIGATRQTSGNIIGYYFILF